MELTKNRPSAEGTEYLETVTPQEFADLVAEDEARCDKEYPELKDGSRKHKCGSTAQRTRVLHKLLDGNFKDSPSRRSYLRETFFCPTCETGPNIDNGIPVAPEGSYWNTRRTITEKSKDKYEKQPA